MRCRLAQAISQILALSRTPLRIVCYHSVLTEHPFLPDHLCVPPSTFVKQLEMIRRHFSVIHFRQIGRDAWRSPLPPLIITFDDGLMDNCQVVLPILRDLGLVATFFVNTLPLDGRQGAMVWTHQVYVLERALGLRQLTRLLLGGDALTVNSSRTLMNYLTDRLSTIEIRRRLDHLMASLGTVPPALQDVYMGANEMRILLDAGMEVGCHSHQHYPFSRLTNLEPESRKSQDILESICGRPIRTFAYPFGDPASFNASTTAHCMNVFDFVCTTIPRVNRAPDLSLLHRVCAYDMRPSKLLLKLMVGR